MDEVFQRVSGSLFHSCISGETAKFSGNIVSCDVMASHDVNVTWLHHMTSSWCDVTSWCCATHDVTWAPHAKFKRTFTHLRLLPTEFFWPLSMRERTGSLVPSMNRPWYCISLERIGFALFAKSTVPTICEMRYFITLSKRFLTQKRKNDARKERKYTKMPDVSWLPCR